MKNKTKLEIMVEMATLLRYLADLVEALVEEKPAPQKEEQAAEKPKINIEEVREVLGRKSTEGFNVQIRKLLAKFGASKLSEVNPNSYADLKIQAEALKNG